MTQGVRGLDEPPVAFPVFHIEELFAFFLRQRFRPGAVFAGFFLVLAGTPSVQNRFEPRARAGEILEDCFAELIVDFRPEVFVAGGEAERLDGFHRELAVEPQQPFDRDLPTTKRGVGEDFRLRGFLESEEGVADATDVGFGEAAAFRTLVLRSGSNRWLAPMICTWPRRRSAFRFESTQM